jgi:hypothetical protein
MHHNTDLDDTATILAQDLGDLVDDYVYKSEELEKTGARMERARCYLELLAFAPG